MKLVNVAATTLNELVVPASIDVCPACLLSLIHISEPTRH